ncbi:hypothetical protein EHQ81_11980 [Leptospira selangorensis]|uniref:ATP-binding protein n=1 Tax=Leptospira selangorensis TaxID=2484982 RepID=A0A5F2C2M6_9LEPT|nr:ATP-binding protein [Leptospira selangorensis]TGM13544.1 hypothetical protein EHQ81_11980 [Leptospira selangorensis]TGM22116.1 hypothetical protein EHQ82_06745 [Leptospira selangorensis]
MQEKEMSLEMNVQMTIIDNLGIKMYSNFDAVLAELISNAYDADSTEVEISIPEGTITENARIIIKDNGLGMDFSEINSTYLNLGRNRRENPATAITPNLKRKVMGRKGIGKLSAFGVSNTIEIQTNKENVETTFLLNLQDIRSTPASEKYKPPFQVAKGKENSGTIVTLSEITRKRQIDIHSLRVKLARRFSCIDSNFNLSINGIAISPDERDLKSKCEIFKEYNNEEINSELKIKINGWIGTLPNQVSSDITPGIVIMVRGRLAQEPSFFDVPSGGWITMAKYYMVGEIHADFLDEDSGDDLILTNRSSIDWTSEFGQALQSWGQNEIKINANSWGENQRRKKEKVIREAPEYSEWLQHLSKPEQKVADKMISALTSEGNLSDDRILELTGFIKSSFDFQVFKELASAISDSPTIEDQKLIELFHEWDIIEAREVFKVAEGRLIAIRQLEKLILDNAREVPDIHNFLGKYPWILDPSWTLAYNEATFTKLLKDHFKEPIEMPDVNRRIDFVCIGAGDTMHIVELKRPKTKIGKNELSQLEDYVAFARQNLGTSPNGRSYRAACGYIIGEEISNDSFIKERLETLERSRMYFRKYSELLSMAQRLHEDFFKKMQKYK